MMGARRWSGETTMGSSTTTAAARSMSWSQGDLRTKSTTKLSVAKQDDQPHTSSASRQAGKGTYIQQSQDAHMKKNENWESELTLHPQNCRLQCSLLRQPRLPQGKDTLRRPRLE